MLLCCVRPTDWHILKLVYRGNRHSFVGLKKADRETYRETDRQGSKAGIHSFRGDRTQSVIPWICVGVRRNSLLSERLCAAALRHYTCEFHRLQFPRSFPQGFFILALLLEIFFILFASGLAWVFFPPPGGFVFS